MIPTRRTVTLHLPEPPSVNRIWRVGRGRTYKVKAAVDYGLIVLAACRTAGIKTVVFPEGPVAYQLTWFRARKAGDLSNRLKVVEDALNGVVWTDDSQVVALTAYRKDAKKGQGGVHLIISEAG